ncbi:MAG: NUDIX hydrolase [Chitinophagaceae bacterium]|nr:NUDIX hydrolase [Chitinophagaceae bacterium]
MNEQHNPWQRLSERKVYDNPWIQVTEYDVINPSGGKGIYGKVHFKNLGIGIIPLDKDLNTYLVGQYRFTLDQYSWEIPEGGCPIGTDPLETAKRELLEETGLIAGQWTHLFDMHLTNSVANEFGKVYLARDLEQRTATPEETEQLSVKKISFEEAYQLVENGTITDSLSMAGIYKIKLMMIDGRIS